MGKLAAKTGGKWGNRASSKTLQQAGDLVGDGTSQEGLERKIRVVDVMVDPKQPRMRLHQLGITPDSIQAHLKGDIDLRANDNPERAEAFDELVALANSIKTNSLLQAIVVIVSEEGKYTIQVGERRFLAHLINRASTIRALVKKPPANELQLRTAQLVENISRVDLDLDERLQSLETIDELLQEEKGGAVGLTSKELVELMGVGLRTAQRYIALLGAPEPVKTAVRNRQITSLQKAVQLASMKPDQRDALLSALIKEGGETADANMESEVKNDKPRKAGRKATAVNMGRVKHPVVVKHIIHQILDDETTKELFSDVDWDDIGSTKQAWDRFLEEMYKQVSVN